MNFLKNLHIYINSENTLKKTFYAFKICLIKKYPHHKIKTVIRFKQNCTHYFNYLYH